MTLRRSCSSEWAFYNTETDVRLPGTERVISDIAGRRSAMALAVQCPHCEASFRLAESTRGKRLRCTNCDKIFTVEEASPLRSGEPRKYRSGPRNSEDDEPPMVLPAEASGTGRRRYEEED